MINRSCNSNGEKLALQVAVVVVVVVVAVDVIIVVVVEGAHCFGFCANRF